MSEDKHPYGNSPCSCLFGCWVLQVELRYMSEMARKVCVYEDKKIMTKFLSSVLWAIINHPVNFKHQPVKNLGIGTHAFQAVFWLEILFDWQISLNKHLFSYSCYIINQPIHQLFILTFSESTAVFSSSSSFTLSWHFCLISAWEIPKSFWKFYKATLHYNMFSQASSPSASNEEVEECCCFAGDVISNIC